MKITFKNVGQGDSIILESNTLQMGIIDCKKYASINPTIEHIKASKLKEILFIALSHPHFDHYSGMLELLQYCETAEINVKYFIHTSNIHPTYLNWHEIEETQSKLLEAIFTKAIQLKQSKQIQYIGYATPGWQLKLGDEFTMQCLSPSDIECRNFTKQVDLFKDSNELKCSQAANLLSSVFEISNSNISFLLTADAEKQTFERLHNDITNVEHLKTQLVLVQVPHHGSANNHYLSFGKT